MKEIEVSGKEILQQLQKNFDVVIPDEERKLFVGKYCYNEIDFKFEMGENILLKDIVEFAKQYALQHIDQADLTLSRSNAKNASIYRNVYRSSIGIVFHDNVTRFVKSPMKQRAENTKSHRVKITKAGVRKLDKILSTKLINGIKNSIGKNAPILNVEQFRTNITFFSADDQNNLVPMNIVGEQAQEQDNNEFFLCGIKANVTCVCGTVLKCSYCSQSSLNFTNSLITDITKCLSDEKIEDLSGFWHLTNFDKHVKLLKHSRTAVQTESN